MASNVEQYLQQVDDGKKEAARHNPNDRLAQTAFQLGWMKQVAQDLAVKCDELQWRLEIKERELEKAEKELSLWQ